MFKSVYYVFYIVNKQVYIIGEVMGFKIYSLY